MTHLDKLDFLLTSLYSDRHGQFQSKEEVYEKVKDKLTFGEVSLYLDRFSSKGYLMTDLREMGKGCISIDVYKISFRGVLFSENSLFILKNRPHIWKSITGKINISWTIAKTIMAASSTLAIIYIGYLQWVAMDKVNNQTDNYLLQIDTLKQKVQLLQEQSFQDHIRDVQIDDLLKEK